MKIYQQTPNHLIRIQIAKLGEETEYITFSETTMDQVEGFLREVIKQAVPADPFIQGKKTSIAIREAWGGKNGKSRSISFRGLSPKQTRELIGEALNPKKKK